MEAATHWLTDEIKAEPDQAALLDKALAQSRAGELRTRAELDAALELIDEPRCSIPGCKYPAPAGLKCGYHTGRDLAARTQGREARLDR